MSFTRLLRSSLAILTPSLFTASGMAATEDQFRDLHRAPDAISVTTEAGNLALQLGGDGCWRGGGVDVIARPGDDGLSVALTAPEAAVKHLRLRWRGGIPASWKCLGDAWERAYGDLQWAAPEAKRAMPWYFLVSDGKVTHGYGVKTQPRAFCHWIADADAIGLDADVRCGGVGVRLGERRLNICTVISRRGSSGETPFQAARAFCRQMCPQPRLPKEPVYGFNDWYCSYGRGTAESFLRDAAYIASLAPTGANRPYLVIDDGWEEKSDRNLYGPWDHASARFGSSMESTAQAIRALDARPGLWYRPLIASPDHPPQWHLAVPRKVKVLDPTVPTVLDHVAADVRRFRAWGYQLIKHDFSTFDLTGRWGFQMGDGIAEDGWTFADRGCTTAEAILRLYRCIREAAGDDTVILGCNTVSHLAAGIFELQRIGDDTSGKDWSRTRKMGVNCLAFRAPQHGTFYAVDADCMGLTRADAIPWEKNRQWLDLLSRSGTPLFVSLKKEDVTPAQEPLLRKALAAAAQPRSLAEPLDWWHTLTPQRWQIDGEEVLYEW